MLDRAVVADPDWEWIRGRLTANEKQ